MADMTRVSMSVRGAEVVTVPIDDTLTIEGQAADAKAVGDALELKADKSELQAAVKVNNQPADAQGLILIDGRHIPVSDEDAETLAVAVTDLKGKTAENIPMSSDSGAKMIAEVVNANAQAIESMEEMTGATMPIESGSQTTVKAAIEARVKTVNQKAPDTDGNVDLSVVPLAENLQSDKMQSVDGTFNIRTTGGSSSVSDGKAYPQHILGTSERTGYVAEELNMTVIPIERTEPDEPITATIDRDVFVAYVDESGTINLYYTTEWSEDPELYGVTVEGTPVAGDQIQIVYVKEQRGTIMVADPDRLVGTGWNLFSYNNGYARVVKYSNEYGYKIGGTFTSIEFSETLEGNRVSILPGQNGLFQVPGDGYVFVSGGNATDTYILATWSDWTDGPATGYWEAYKESGIDLSAVMGTYFPYGMLSVGTIHDEIDLSAKRTISRVERMAYTAENLAAAMASGREYTYDTNYIYLERAESVISAITIDTVYNVSEHGLEWFTETTMPLITEILYGKNLRDKLERDVLTISQQTLAEEEKAQVRENIGVMDPPTNGNGTPGQLLKTNGDGTTEWTTQGTPTDAQVGTAVSAWLTAHPEATTTVQDGAISRAKLDADLKAKTDAVPELKSTLSDNMTAMEDSLLSVVNLMPYVTETGLINTSGSPDTNANYRRSGFIPVSKGSIINYSAYAKTGANILSFYTRMDESSYQSGVEGVGASSGKSGQFPAGSTGFPSSGFVRICVANAKFSNCNITMTSAMKTETDGIKKTGSQNHEDIEIVAERNDEIDAKTLLNINGYLNTDGTVNDVNVSDYKRSKYIFVKKGDEIEITWAKATSGRNILSFYTNSDISSYADGVTGAGTNTVNTVYRVPEDGYIMLSCVADQLAYNSTTVKIRSVLKKTEETFLTENSLKVRKVTSLLSIDGLTNNDGTFNDANISTYKRSGFIPVKQGETINITNGRGSAQQNILSFYKFTTGNEIVYADGIAGIGGSKDVNTNYVITNDGYIVLCCVAGRLEYDTTYFTITGSAKGTFGKALLTEDNPFIKQLVDKGLDKLLQYNSDHRCLNFALITDTHMYPEAPNFSCKNSVRLFNEIGKFTEFSVHCGDVAESGNMTPTGLTTDTYVPKNLNYESLGTFIAMVRNTQQPIYICHGNHDVSRYETEIPGTNAIVEQAWNLQCGKLAKERVTNPNDPYSNYYYVDYDEFKCRVVVVDYFGKDDGTYPTATQGCSATAKAWLQDVALDLTGKTTPTEWTVLMFSHAQPITSLKDKIKQIRSNGIALIFIHGNDHRDDYTNDIFSDETYFNNIGVDKAFVKEWNSQTDANLIGTINEFCVDLFTIDFEQGKIYETRLGRGTDREYVFSGANESADNNIVEAEET